MKRRWLFNVLAVLFLVTSLFGGLANASAVVAAPAESNAADKIEPALLTKFAQEGTAEFIIRFTEQADLSAAYDMDWNARGEYVYNTLKEAAARSQARVKGMLDAARLEYQTYIAGNDLYVKGGNLELATALATLDEVYYIRATRTYHIDPVTMVNPLENITWGGDLLSMNLNANIASPDALAWGISNVKADQFWETFGVQGDGIKVANIDTGVQWDHPALDQAYACPSDPDSADCWLDPTSTCVGEPCDNNGHGTHTMGTMVADDDPSLTYQAGMAPNSTWIACKGCETSSCSDTALNACADWILAPGGSAANRPNVVNNSWGGGGGDNWYLAKVNAWRAAGIFPAFSAGNAGPDCGTNGSPGDYQESFASGGFDSARNVYTNSGRGPSVFGDDPYTKPNISAPAVSVCSTIPTDGWTCGYTGTSMASPHSAGAVALLWSCNAALVGDINGTFEALQDTADAPPAGNCGAPTDGEGNYTFGYGYLNVLAAGIGVCGGVETGSIDGYVYDSAGNPLEGAMVEASPSVASADIEAITDPTGYYTMTLPVGFWDVTASMTAYAEQTITGIEVVAGGTTSQDFYLEYAGTWMAGPDISACFDLTRIDAEYYDGTGLVYIMGGRSDTSTIANIYSFDPVTGNCADTGADMVDPVSNYTIALVDDGANDLLCTFGGRGSGGSSTQTVQCYNPNTNAVTDVTDLPAAYSGFTPGGLAVVDNMVYVFGGLRTTASPYELTRTDRYDPVNNTWTQVGDLGLGRAYIQVAVVDGKIYAFGGNTFDGTGLVAETYAEVMADPGGAGTWAAIEPLATASGEGRGFGFDSDSEFGLANQIVLAGGGIWSSMTNAALVYDVATDSYDETFPDLLQGRRDHAGVFVPIDSDDPDDGLPGMWVFGGYIGTDAPPYGDPEYFPLELAVPDIAVAPTFLDETVLVDTPKTVALDIMNEGGGVLTWTITEMEGHPLQGISLVDQTAKSSISNEPHPVILTLGGQAGGGNITAAPTVPEAAVSLFLDDGSAENSIGLNDGTYDYQYLWFNRFTPDAADFPFNLEQIQVFFGSGQGVNVGDAIDLVVYQDADGDPSNGATWLATYPEAVQAVDGTTWSVYDLPSPLLISGPGDVLIGAINRYTESGVSLATFPAALDQTASQQRSWVAAWSADPPVPPVLPPDAGGLYGLIDAWFPGNWLVRASGQTGAVDVPWLSEDPTSGAGDVTVDVTFDPTGMAVGQYYATLQIDSNDPVEPVVYVPVTMTIVELEAGVTLTPDTDALSGDPGATVAYTLVLENTGNYEDTFTLAGTGDWVVDLPVTSFYLEPGETADVTVNVTVPSDALAGDSDVSTITATSTNDGDVSDASDLTTTANQVFGVEITPEDAQSGDPGEVVAYTLVVTNTGNSSDTFEFSVAGNAWDVHFPVTSTEIAAGASVNVPVEVTVFETALPGDLDVATVMATAGDGSFAESELTTTANAVYAFSLTPAADAQEGLPGETMTYTLLLSNLGNLADSYTLTIAGNTWVVVLPEDSFDLAVGESAPVVVLVTIPAGAADGEDDAVTVTVTAESGAEASSVLTTTAVLEVPGGNVTVLPFVVKDY